MPGTDPRPPSATQSPPPAVVREGGRTLPSPALAEARRTMEICNACRYCESFCPVFPAMELRRAFSDGDLGYLANLCHNCKGCWHACQYAPPHEWGLNLPRAFAELRAETYASHAWPRGLGRVFERNGMVVSLATALCLAAVMILTVLLQDQATLSASHGGPGAFYAVIPWGVMAGLGGLTFGWAVLAMALGARSFWRASGGGAISRAALRAALRDAGQTRHLGGGGEGCNDIDERFGMGRRHFHLAMMWGFLLCFAATIAGTVMDHGFGWAAPYSWYSVPVVLGTAGGIGLMAGTAGLFAIKFATDRAPEATGLWGMDLGLLALLHLTALTGLALLAWRHTPAMGWLLAIHLGFVLALFVTLPYGKMVHGVYRLLALVRHHREQQAR
ncbi:MAG: tricarballylate utilization 4Fe-4S protein TcuB [Proteobacteria bacterium]|nr:tricarballylate utilization 4Fe-4S protein TcuB [Pseudomonadota bacterium]